jgi:predicted nucleotidyltransferase
MEIIAEQKGQLRAIGEEYNLRFIILHGSYAKGISCPGSDLDIAILGKEYIDGGAYLKIFNALEGVFGNNRERELDVKILHGADPLFRYQVTDRATLLYGDTLDFHEFQAYAFRAFAESKDLRDLEEALLRKSIVKLSTHYARS